MPDWTPTLVGNVNVNRTETFVVQTAGERCPRWSISYHRLTGFCHTRKDRADAGSARTFRSGANSNPFFNEPVERHRCQSRIYQLPTALSVVIVIKGTQVPHVEPVFFAQGFHSASFVLRIDD